MQTKSVSTRKEFFPTLCGSTLFFTILRFKKKKSGNQDECFKDFLSVIDPASVEYVPERTLHRYASDCKQAKALPEDSGCVRFGDKEICRQFRDEMKNAPQAVLDRVRSFADKYFGAEKPSSLHRNLVRALLCLIEDDKSIDEGGRSLFINPGFRPSLKEEILDGDATIYFYNFLLGVWYYVYFYAEGSEEGRPTIEQWTVGTKEYSADKVKDNIDDETRYTDIILSYETEVEYDEKLEVEESETQDTRIVLPWGKVPDLATFDPEDEDGVLVVQAIKLDPVSDKFSKYVNAAVKNYSMKKGFLDTRERPFREFYVCNNVSHAGMTTQYAAKVFGENDKKPQITNITVDQINYDFSIFTGIGGMGKSMLLLKFLLDEAEAYKPGGRVPIMITLRSYRPDKKSIEMLLALELKRFDPTLQLADLYYLLDTGRAVCLLDGFDEIKKEYVHEFQDELDILKDGRPRTKFIMSSRDIPAIRTLNHYHDYTLENLTIDQACDLISKLDPERIDQKLKSDFINKLRHDAFHFNRDEKRDFVGNPLFLSLMIRTYDMIHEIPAQRYVFYEKTYTAMASEYDAKTKRLTRPFFTGLNETTFKRYFAEFCGLSYADSQLEFDHDLMMRYFQQVIEDNGLSIDPYMFIKDITEILCLMYKDGNTYEFIHRSFQEYFAAVYYLALLSTDASTVVETLKEMDSRIKKDETLYMMYGMNSDVMEKYVILPFLKEMFASDDPDNDYRRYLKLYYAEIEYVTGDLDEDMCNNDDQSSAMFSFMKKQYGIDYGYLSDAFDRDEFYADNYEEYYWIEETWIEPSSHIGNMLLVQKNDIPIETLDYYGVELPGDLPVAKGNLCQVNVSSALLRGTLSNGYDATGELIMSSSFPLREEFDQFRELYEKLKEKYDGAKKPVKRRLGLKRN